MSEEQQSCGYIYRIARADQARLATIIATCVGTSGWTFGGAAQWDFDSRREHKNLREIEPISTTGAIDSSGDFGHAFSKHAEVRWKRRDDGDYDVLILSEAEQTIEGAQPLPGGKNQHWRTRSYTQAAIVRADNRPTISYIDYIAANGAVQFQRLVEV